MREDETVGSKTLALSAVRSVEVAPKLSGFPCALDGFCQLPRHVSGKKSLTSARVESFSIPQKRVAASTTKIPAESHGCRRVNLGRKLRIFLPWRRFLSDRLEISIFSARTSNTLLVLLSFREGVIQLYFSTKNRMSGEKLWIIIVSPLRSS